MSAITTFRHIICCLPSGLYLKINFADIWLVYAYTVIYLQPPSTLVVTHMEPNLPYRLLYYSVCQ